MTDLQTMVVRFLICLLITLFFSYLGDDDVVYFVVNRKPTPREGRARIRYVIAKMLASVSGGILSAYLLAQHILKALLVVHVTNNEFVCLVCLCSIGMGTAIGVLQNQIRYLQGRQKRPLVPVNIIKKNLMQWGSLFRTRK